MRIVKTEKIFLSQNEMNTWSNFYTILKGMERECENPNTVNLVQKIQVYLNDLWEEVEGVE